MVWPGCGRLRIARGVLVAGVCLGLPLYGHRADTVTDRGPEILVLLALLCACGIRLAANPLSFRALLTGVVGGQLAAHAALAMSLDGPDSAPVSHVPGRLAGLAWVAGDHGAVRMVVSHLALAVVAAVALYACESGLWAWFRVQALRLLVPIAPTTPHPVLPDRVRVPVATDDVACRPALVAASGLGRRGPPLRLSF